SRAGRMPRKLQSFRRVRRNYRRPVADDEQAGERASAGRIQNGGERKWLVVEADGDRAILPRVLEHVTAVRRKHQLHTEPFGCLAERARLIASCRRKEENSRHSQLSE